MFGLEKAAMFCDVAGRPVVVGSIDGSWGKDGEAVVVVGYGDGAEKGTLAWGPAVERPPPLVGVMKPRAASHEVDTDEVIDLIPFRITSHHIISLPAIITPYTRQSSETSCQRQHP
jgi:hypothetical protein